MVYAFSASAVKIRFPDEELATESVLPLIEPHRIVLNRNVPLRFRAELGLGGGIRLTEPLYFPVHPSGFLTFHLSDTHALGVTLTYFPPLLSGTGEQFAGGIKGESSEGGRTFTGLSPLNIPYPTMMGFLNYQYTPFYGKISLTKKGVMNLSIYGFAGPGLVVLKQNIMKPAGNLGIGQKLYFNRWLGLKIDLGLFGYYGPFFINLIEHGMVQDTEIPYDKINAEGKEGLIIHIVANIGVIFLI